VPLSLTEVARQVGGGLLDLIYPPRCLICDADGESAICEACSAEFTAIPEPVCRVCGRPIDGSPCRACSIAAANGGWAFVSARASGIYDGPLRQAIHELKYHRREGLGEPLGAHLANRLIVDELFPADLLSTIDAVVPVPVHPAHRRRRGYNQTELLARPVAEMLGLPLRSDVIRRVGPAAAQVGLSLNARRANVSAATFHVRDPAFEAGKTFLLIDDVFTTGATVSACADALRMAGAAAVVVGVLAAGD
jgi:competence protein ComFC